MLAAQTEARHDDYEREAQLAIMREHASRAKKPKASDLYKRPATKAATKEIENQAAKAEHAQEWLGQFAFEARGK